MREGCGGMGVRPVDPPFALQNGEAVLTPSPQDFLESTPFLTAAQWSTTG